MKSVQLTVALAGLVVCATVFLYVGIPYLYGKYLRILLGNKAAKLNALVLTFDDGPGHRLTPQLLNLLAEHKARATFFLLGKNIAGNETIVRRIAAEGHEICSHGYDHLHYWKVSPLRALTDIKRGWQAIDAVFQSDKGIYPFRPPGGKLNIVCLLYLLVRRVPIYYWSLDTGDTWPGGHRRDSQNVETLIEKAGGGITLAHDFDRSDHSVDQVILDWVRSLLTFTQRNKIRVLTVSELLQI